MQVRFINHERDIDRTIVFPIRSKKSFIKSILLELLGLEEITEKNRRISGNIESWEIFANKEDQWKHIAICKNNNSFYNENDIYIGFQNFRPSEKNADKVLKKITKKDFFEIISAVDPNMTWLIKKKE